MPRHYNPYAPEIVRKDLNEGYTKENCLVVCKAVYDLMGDNMGEEDLFKFAERVACYKTTLADEDRLTKFCRKPGMSREFVHDLCDHMLERRAQRNGWYVPQRGMIT